MRALPPRKGLAVVFERFSHNRYTVANGELMNQDHGFRKLLTPRAIEFIYMVEVLACVILGGWMIFMGVFAPESLGVTLIGILVLVLGLLVARFQYEVSMALIQIHDAVTELDKKPSVRGRRTRLGGPKRKKGR